VTLSAARRLARFVVDLALTDVPPPVVEKAGCWRSTRSDVASPPRDTTLARPRARPPSASVDLRRALWSGARCGWRRPTPFGAIAVLGLVMLVMTFATLALVRRVLGRDFLGTRE